MGLGFGLGSVWWSGHCTGKHILFSCGTITWHLIKRRKWTQDAFNTEPSSALDCLFRTSLHLLPDYSNERFGVVRLLFSFTFSYHILLHPFVFMCVDLQLASDSWLSWTAQRIQESIKGEFMGRSCLDRVHWCHTLARVALGLALGQD